MAALDIKDVFGHTKPFFTNGESMKSDLGAYEDFIVYHNAQHAQLLEEAGFATAWENQGDRILKQFAGSSTDYPST